MKPMFLYPEVAFEVCIRQPVALYLRRVSRGDSRWLTWLEDTMCGDLGEVATAWKCCARTMITESKKVFAKRALSIVDHYSRGMLVWRNHRTPNEPHQELIPWMGLFRPLDRTLWHLFIAYPEDADLLRV